MTEPWRDNGYPSTLECFVCQAPVSRPEDVLTDAEGNPLGVGVCPIHREQGPVAEIWKQLDLARDHQLLFGYSREAIREIGRTVRQFQQAGGTPNLLLRSLSLNAGIRIFLSTLREYLAALPADDEEFTDHHRTVISALGYLAALDFGHSDREDNPELHDALERLRAEV